MTSPWFFPLLSPIISNSFQLNMTLSSWIRSFKPPADREGVVVNPLTVLRAIDLQGYLFIFAGWVAWTADG